MSQSHHQNGSFHNSLWLGQSKATTKVWVVFDGLARQDGKSLNSESLPSPKLQSDIVDVLIKFRKEPVALAGDVSQMYHRIPLRPEDRPLHRFLYRNLGSGVAPKVYEFKRFVFALLVSSLLGNIMPDFTRRLTHWELMQF